MSSTANSPTVLTKRRSHEMASFHFKSIRELRQHLLKLNRLLADDVVRLACHHRVLGQHEGDRHETLLCSRLRQRLPKHVLQILRDDLDQLERVDL